MFKEFNVKFEDAEIIGGADNLLEGTGVTKVILRGDNKLSSLDSTFKNCSQLDTVDGELDLNGISDIDSLLEGSNLVTSIDLKNVNNKDITANNAFSHVNQINIGGETYNKEAIQNIISSREWTFNNINYIDTVGENVITHTSNITEEDENTQIVINDALEQKARNVEIKGQTYQNLIQGKEGVELLADIKFESIDGSPSELEPPIDHPVCVEVVEGQTYQNLIQGKGEYNLTDTYSTTWTESNYSIDNPPSMIEIPEIWGNTVQGYENVVTEKMIYDSITNSSAPVKVTMNSDGSIKASNWNSLDGWIPSDEDMEKHSIKLKPNTTYSMCAWRKETGEKIGSLFRVESDGFKGGHTSSYKFTTDETGRVFLCVGGLVYNQVVRVYEGDISNISDLYSYDLNYIQSVGDLYVDEEGNPILDEDGNEQYKIEIETYSKGNLFLNDNVLKFESNSNWDIIKNGINSFTMTQKIRQNYLSSVPIILPKGEYTFRGELNSGRCDSFVLYLNGNRIYASSGNINVEFVVDKYSEFYFSFRNYSETSASNPVSSDFTFNLVRGNLNEYVNTPSSSNKTTILLPQQLKGLSDVKDRLFYDYTKNMYVIENKIGDFNNINDLSEAILSIPKMTETKILEKPSLETYSPKTYISTNTEVEPSQMTITNKKTNFIPLGLQANKDYTLQLDSVGKDDKLITVNLGGSAITTQPVNDTSTHHKVVIKTPTTLTTDKLELSGEGVVVNDVMLFEGGSDVIKQEVEYIEGVQNIGELQEDGTYKIDILSNDDLFANFLYDKSKNINGYELIGLTGSLQANVNRTTTDFIKVPNDGKYYINTSKEFQPMILQYDKNKNYIPYNSNGYDPWAWSSSYKNNYYNLHQENTCYIRVSLNLNDIDCLNISLNNDKTYPTPVGRSTTQSILLPQQLNKIGDVKDKLYWDEDKGHYCIEQNVENYIITKDSPFIYRGYKSLNVYAVLDKEALGYDLTNKISLLGIKQYNQFPYQADELGYYINNETGEIEFVIHKLKVTNSLEGILSKLFEVQEEFNFMYGKTTPNIIDLSHLNKKYSLDTYMPTTYLECSNSPMQPSKMYFETDKLKYKPLALEADKSYTIQFNCEKVSEEKVKFNLGGSEEEIQAVVGTNHINITTPAELSSDRLYISGQGNKISDTMLFVGDMKQSPEYFDSIESVGELQEDGKYKIDISSSYKFIDTSSFVAGRLDKGVLGYQNEANVTINEDTIKCTTSSNWKGCTSGFAKIKPMTEYSFEYTISSSVGEVFPCPHFYTKDKVYISDLYNKSTFTSPDNAEYVRIYFAHAGIGEFTIKNFNFLDKSTQSFTLQQPLMKVGDIADKLYWDHTQEKYCIERNVGVVTYNGDETWTVQTLSSDYNSVASGFYTSIENAQRTTTDTSLVINDSGFICYSDAVYSYKPRAIGINRSGRLYLSLYNDEFGYDGVANSATKLSLFKEYLSSNPVTVYYSYTTPIIEEVECEGEVVNLPRLYQREETCFNVTTGNLRPSNIMLEYKNI